MKPTVLKLVQQWLERTPGLEEEGFNFPLQYKNAVEKFLQAQKDSIKVHRKYILNVYVCYTLFFHADAS